MTKKEKEAIERGFIPGVRFRSAITNEIFKIGRQGIVHHPNLVYNLSAIGGGCVYDAKTDTWAEIIKE